MTNCVDSDRAVKRALGLRLITLATSLTLLSPVTTFGQTQGDGGGVSEARARYAQGRALYSAGKYTEARAELEAALALAPTYRLLYDLALATEAQGDRSAAIRYLQRYLAEGRAEIEPARRTEATELLTRLRSRVGLVTIHTNVAGDAGVTVDEQAYGEVSDTPLVLLPGARTIWVTKAGYYPSSRLVALKEGDAIDVNFELRELPRAQVAKPPWWRNELASAALFIVAGALLIAILLRKRRTRASTLVHLNPYEGEGRQEPPSQAQTNVIQVEPAGDSAAEKSFAISAAAATDIGRVKPSNEDSHLVDVAKGLFVVADGIGGFAGGGVASATAVEAIGTYFAGKKDVGLLTHLPKPAAELASAVFFANAVIRRKQVATPNIADMGSTCVAARFVPDQHQLFVVHIGDSRVYRFRGSKLEQLTTDHTMAELGVTGRRAQHLSRALGSEASPRVDVLCVHPEANDQYLLCCDGLSKMLSDDALLRIMEMASSSEEAVAQLVASANEAGGLDNITALVVRLTPRP